MEKTVFLFLGTVRPYKGLDVLREAVSSFAGDKRVQWVLAGDFWRGTHDFRQSMERSGARVMAGYQPWTTVADLMAACDLMILPYHHASGSGILMMAYAHGIPVLVTATDHLKDYLPKGYPDLQAGDSAGFIRLLRDAADRQKFCPGSGKAFRNRLEGSHGGNISPWPSPFLNQNSDFRYNRSIRSLTRRECTRRHA